MSSKKWLAQNGFSTHLKKIASSEKLKSLLDSSTENCSSSSSDGEGEERSVEVEGQGAFDAIWKPIQDEQNKKELERAGHSHTWSSILTQKVNDDKSGTGVTLPPPYVHPLVKRSASSLSDKSLEICTESLGSETGSDGFSAQPRSKPGDSEVGKEEEETQEEEEERENYSRPIAGEEFQVVKYNYPSSCKKAPQRSFPPPLPSLANSDWCNVHLRSLRQKGRLVVDAVTVPSQNCFRTERQDGRLLLTLTNNTEMEEENYVQDDEEEEEVQDEDEETLIEEDNDSGAAEMELANLMESVNVRQLPAGMMSMHKLISITKASPWPHEFNKVTTTLVEAAQEDGGVMEDDDEVEVVKSLLPSRTQLTRLIPTAPATTTSTLNPYEYYWRSKEPSAAAMVAVLTSSQQPPRPPPLRDNKYNGNKYVVGQNVKSLMEQQEMAVVKGEKADYLVPIPALRNCKEQRRRSLLIWEPYCIATS